MKVILVSFCWALVGYLIGASIGEVIMKGIRSTEDVVLASNVSEATYIFPLSVATGAFWVSYKVYSKFKL